MGEHPGVAEKRRRLKDPEIRRWYDNVARGSVITADNYLRSLFGFSTRTGLSPVAVAKLDRKKAHRVLLDFVSSEEKRGMTGSTVLTYVKAVRSWLMHHGKKIDMPVKIRDAQRTPTLADERVPTPDELRAVLLAATPQQRVAAALMAFSGLRPEVLGNYHGNDGLRISDLPDLRLKSGRVEFEQIPAMVRVRGELSKNGSSYFAFIGKEGVRYLAEYLEQRIREGEKVGPSTDVLHPVWAPKLFLRSVKVSEGVKTAIVKAGFQWRPYVLRAYFDTQLLLAESKGKVAHDYRVFWMGHRGSIENRYTTNKGRLPADLVDDMREAYGRCESFLATDQSEPVVTEADLKKAILSVLLPKEEVAKLDVTKMSTEEVRRVITERLQGARAAIVSPGMGTDSIGHLGQVGQLTNGFSEPLESVVRLSELRDRLAAGWVYVAQLPHDEAIIRRPANGGGGYPPIR
ncbi:MAG: site-specific integrase [Thermoplasmata archaeon]